MSETKQETQQEEDNAPIITVNEKVVNIQLHGEISQETINPLVDFLITSSMSDEDFNVVNLFIDSEGGDLDAAMKLIDAMRMSSTPVRTIAWGKVYSAGLLIFMSGQERLISQNCSILSHNATFNATSYSVKINDHSQQQDFKLTGERIMGLYETATGHDRKFIKRHLLRDHDVYLSAEQAVLMGLADDLLPRSFADLIKPIDKED